MKCPACGNNDQQSRIGPTSEQREQLLYRCSACGRLYTIEADLVELIDRLDELKVKAETMAEEQLRLTKQITGAEKQLNAAKTQLEAADQRLKERQLG